MALAPPFLRLSELLVAGSNFTTNAVSPLLIIAARHRGASPGVIGVMLGSAAAGGLLGSLAAVRLHKQFRARLIVVGYGWVGVVVLLGLSAQPPVLALGLIFACWLFFGPTWDAVVVGYRVRICPDALQGRVESVSTLLSFGASALGPLAAGILAARLPTREAFLALAAWTATVALAGTLSRSTRSIEAQSPA